MLYQNPIIWSLERLHQRYADQTLLSEEKSVRGSQIMEMILKIKKQVLHLEIYFTWSDICYLNLTGWKIFYSNLIPVSSLSP